LIVADQSKCAPLLPNRLSPRSGVAKPVSTCCHVLLVPLLLIAVAHSQDVHVRVSPDVKTGIEGTTEFPTIQMALDHHPLPKTSPDGKLGRVLIEIEPGVYRERVNVTQNHPNITLIGKGKSPADVVITNSLNAKQAGGTFFTETVEVNGPGFEAAEGVHFRTEHARKRTFTWGDRRSP